MAKAKVRQKGARLTERTKGETEKPVKLLQLIATMGITRAARQLGISTTTIHKARRHNVVSRVIEIAAANVLRDLAGKADGDTPKPAVKSDDATISYLMIVARSKAGVVEQFAKAINATLVET